MVEFLKRNIFLIGIVIFIGFFLFVNKDGVDKDTAQSNEIPLEVSEERTQAVKEKPTKAIVDVKGAVVKPGVYEISMESRVNDVITLAGGFTKDADQTMVNLAQKVQDEMVIMIPKVGEAGKSNQANGSKADSGGTEKVRINYASQEEIETLNGIGPSKAQAIIQYRDEHGFFKTIDDLLEVSGIGPKTVENIKEGIQIP